MVVGMVNPARRKLPALKLVQSSATARRLAKGLFVFLLIAIVAMMFTPWQQSARGTGKVVAYVPQERQQTVTSPVKGVVVTIASDLREGMRVERNDVILELEPYAANLKEQLTGQLANLKTKLATAETKQEVYSQNEIDFEEAKNAAVAAAVQLMESANSKYKAESNLLPGYQAKVDQLELNYKRQKGLADKGIKPQVEIEKLKKDWDVALSELDSLKLKIDSARQEWEAKKQMRTQKEREAKTKVDYARAMQQDAIGLASTTRKEMRDLEIKLSELDRMEIKAPRDGVIFRMPIFERGQTLKEGDPLFTIVPDVSEQIVELWVSGNDMPLIQRGDDVRLQFEGWPAVQFAGWPSVAVGTFGGKVAAIDPADDGKGKFRIQVEPEDPAAWPSERYLRQGVRANGWVMLSQVSLGYEFWRQLNGFPPVVSPDEPDGKSNNKKKKAPLPK
ncbi:MAG: HlyD family secretion protein [bacterium]|nr:HlyD family secretion protein [bacterium]